MSEIMSWDRSVCTIKVSPQCSRARVGIISASVEPVYIKSRDDIAKTSAREEPRRAKFGSQDSPLRRRARAAWLAGRLEEIAISERSRIAAGLLCE